MVQGSIGMFLEARSLHAEVFKNCKEVLDRDCICQYVCVFICLLYLYIQILHTVCRGSFLKSIISSQTPLKSWKTVRSRLFLLDQ